MIALILEGDIKAARKEHFSQLDMAKGLFIVSNPIPVKYSLNYIGFNVGTLRLPLLEADSETASYLENLIN